jgi:nitrous oxidase accessory protein NosD
MKTFMLANTVVATMLALFLPAGPAQAQTRTWVASTGSDANLCTRTSPCQTLAGAISKTAAGGEVSIIDSAVYVAGTLTINKAITINGEGALASVIASSGTAITVAANAGDQVIIRNLFINGAGGGSIGISLVRAI